MQLTDIQKQLAWEMLKIAKSKDRPFIFYHELAVAINNKVAVRGLGIEIGPVSILCDSFKLPLLSAIVVNQETLMPGDGFVKIIPHLNFNKPKSKDEMAFCINSMKAVKECLDWSKLEDYLNDNQTQPQSTEKPQIRIIPMWRDEFTYKGYFDVQNNYFLDKLINEEKGSYHYRKVGIVSVPNSLFLFQYENQIIASAIFLGLEKHAEPLEGEYYGAYVFDTKSIRVFEPITASEFKEIVSEFNGFGRDKQKIDSVYLPKINALIEQKIKKRKTTEGYIAKARDEISRVDEEAAKDDAKFVSSVNSESEQPIGDISYKPKKAVKAPVAKGGTGGYKRDAQTSRTALRLANYECEICGTKNLFLRKACDYYYTEPHHLIPISLQGSDRFTDEQGLDNIANIVSLCSHCHNLMHYGRLDDKEQHLETLYNDRKSKLKEADILISWDEMLEIYR